MKSKSNDTDQQGTIWPKWIQYFDNQRCKIRLGNQTARFSWRKNVPDAVEKMLILFFIYRSRLRGSQLSLQPKIMEYISLFL